MNVNIHMHTDTLTNYSLLVYHNYGWQPSAKAAEVNYHLIFILFTRGSWALSGLDWMLDWNFTQLHIRPSDCTWVTSESTKSHQLFNCSWPVNIIKRRRRTVITDVSHISDEGILLSFRMCSWVFDLLWGLHNNRRGMLIQRSVQGRSSRTVPSMADWSSADIAELDQSASLQLNCWTFSNFKGNPPPLPTRETSSS